MSDLPRSDDGAADQRDAAKQSDGRLGGVQPLAHDDDERPRREDMSYGQTIFTRPPVSLPRWLRGPKR
jgi:hypothetical protein